MKLLFKIFIAYLLFPLCLSHGATPILFTVNELIEGKQLYNNLVIHYKGEVVGQRLSRTSNVWVNVLDYEGNALGAFMTRELSDTIQNYGTYKTQGDEVVLEGVFHSKCEEHGGDTDIHVQKLEILQVGFARETDKMNMNLIISCFILFLFILFLLYRKKKATKATI